MTSILAIETATSACSVALLYQGHIAEQFEVGSNIHSRQLLSMVDKLLQQASINVNQLDAIAVGQGPGSFTGLRIGVGVGQGLAYSASVPMIPICPLETLANQFKAERILVGLDARMSEIYWSGFVRSDDILSKTGKIKVTSPADIVLPDQHDWLAVGTAWLEYKDLLTVNVKKKLMVEDAINYPKAKTMVKLAKLKLQKNEVINALDFAPVYIRNDVAKKSVVNKGSAG